ncbi:MAG: ATP synthase F0 subunit A [Rickettsiales bacterium]|nr:ATP synthase F0 subunit A [Rickettsiales bacterium]
MTKAKLQQFKDLFFSPLEQFENNAITISNYVPEVPEEYLVWGATNNYAKMIEYENQFYFVSETFYDFTDTLYFAFISLFFILVMGLILNVDKNVPFSLLFNLKLVVVWVVTKFFLTFITSTSINFEFFLTYSDEVKRVEPFMIPVNHSGFILNDSMCFFITALLFLYLVTFFTDLHNSKGPFLVSKDALNTIQLNIYKVTVDLIASSIDKDLHSQSYHAFVYTLFTYLIICNVQGLVPFTITVTSQLICTFWMAQVVMLYVIITILLKKGFRYFLTLFMPSGAPLALGYLLIPIEIVSFFFKTVSLSVRLFANMMAGHTLLKVILGFAWTILIMSEIFFIINIFPIVILILLTVLEIGVSLIQAYIFSILTCLYLRDAFAGH